MTKERLEHLRLMADQCENIDPTDTRELLDEIERLQAIEAAAKECPMKWKCSKCGTWLDDTWCISNPDWHIGNDWDKCGPAIKVLP